MAHFGVNYFLDDVLNKRYTFHMLFMCSGMQKTQIPGHVVAEFVPLG